MPSIQIRKFKSTDITSSLEVYKHLCIFYNRPFNFEQAKKFLSARAYLDQYLVLVAIDMDTKQVVAMAFGEISTEETQETIGYIKLIYVEESYRNQGIMTELINNMTNYFFKEIQVDKVRIFLNNTNLPYLSYYSEKLGFHPIYTIVEKENP
ncbi:MAG: GNAT family N-acetyltransferase [Candidatus Helarchaeota archaeon]